jgi:hypothetical protein
VAGARESSSVQSDGDAKLSGDFDEFVDAHLTQLPRADLNAYTAAFERANGRIENTFFSNSGAVVFWMSHRSRFLSHYMIRRRPVCIKYRTPSALEVEFARTLFLADQVITEAKRTLSGRPLILCFEMVFSALAYLFKVADPVVTASSQRAEGHANSLPDEKAETNRIVTEHLNAARSFYVSVAVRRATLEYVVGMVLGTLVLTVGLLLLAPYLERIRVAVNEVVVGSSLAAGGMGAILSVMMRMSGGQLTFSADVTRLETVIVGAFRPVVGVLSGFLIYALVNSGLLPLKTPAESPGVDGWYFFVTLAFVAGFSERLIQDVIVRAEKQVGQRSEVAADRRGNRRR